MSVTKEQEEWVKEFLATRPFRFLPRSTVDQYVDRNMGSGDAPQVICDAWRALRGHVSNMMGEDHHDHDMVLRPGEQRGTVQFQVKLPEGAAPLNRKRGLSEVGQASTEHGIIRQSPKRRVTLNMPRASESLASPVDAQDVVLSSNKEDSVDGNWVIHPSPPAGSQRPFSHSVRPFGSTTGSQVSHLSPATGLRPAIRPLTGLDFRPLPSSGGPRVYHPLPSTFV